MALSEKQRKMVKDAIGDGSDWPKLTTDPQVNCAVDVEVCNHSLWDELDDKFKKAYVEEAANLLKKE